jgi:tRNA-dihydrouridine synthase
MIGHNIPGLVRTARQLQAYPIGGIDLNLGCPAPVVYRKCVGGGLLREPQRVDAILAALRDAVTTKLTVKARIGFDSPALFDDLLGVFARHRLDLVTVHGRTVAEMYRSEVHYDLIARAVRCLPCPVLANGNVSSPGKALRILQETGARGLMIGRGAIRNPWMFAQIRQALRGETVRQPTGRDVLAYLEGLFEATRSPGFTERSHVQRVKKYVTFVGLGIEPTGDFLHQIRRVATEADFDRVCRAFLDHDDPMPLEPFPLPLKETDVLAGVHE